jgi:short-subunit dehydrogenase
MTAHLPKNFLFASPSKVASNILHAMDKRRDVLFAPWFWRWIMLVVRLIPEGIFKKLKL